MILSQHVLGLPFFLELGPVYLFFFLDDFVRDLFPLDVERVGRGDLHGDLFDQRLEIFGAGDEVRLAVDFDEHAELPAGMDIGSRPGPASPCGRLS